MTAESVTHWDNAQVAYFGEDVTAEQSLAAMERRNAMYPGLLELMPIALPGKTIIDFGCGPGHDTIGFLLNNAEHVYAVDSSWQGLTSLWYRLNAHGFTERCTLIRVGEGDWRLPEVEYIHCAGVLHHIEDPGRVLQKLRDALQYEPYSERKIPGAEIRLMVYDAESQYVRNSGGPEDFEQIADGSAPIAKAWTYAEVVHLAKLAGLKATYLGGYLMSESQGPGLGGCWSLKP